mmetsp:Transcript_81573/g.132207  ORF Transcript_81573/g.132207 Transcript_81573/m.132207 type:complete len:279 (-) Transcript_81573:75-911(-)
MWFSPEVSVSRSFVALGGKTPSVSRSALDWVLRLRYMQTPAPSTTAPTPAQTAAIMTVMSLDLPSDSAGGGGAADTIGTDRTSDTTGSDRTSASGRPAFDNCALIFSTLNFWATDAAAFASFAATSTSILIPSARRCRLPVVCVLMLVIVTLPTATKAALAMPCLKVSCFALSNSAMEILSPIAILTRTSVADGESGGKTSDGGSLTSSWHGPPSGPVHPALHVQAVKVALFLAELELSGQASHAVNARLEYLPASHSMQSSEEELPSVDKCVPAGQS